MTKDIDDKARQLQERVRKGSITRTPKKELDNVAMIVNVIKNAGGFGDILGRTFDVDLLVSGNRITGTITQRKADLGQINSINKGLHLMAEVENQEHEKLLKAQGAKR